MSKRLATIARHPVRAAALLALVALAALVAFGIQDFAGDRTEAAGGGFSGVVDWKQCANDDSPLDLGDCYWINGILQQNNSEYFEGMGVPERAIFLDIDPLGIGSNMHTLTFGHEWTKTQGGTAFHAYDFLMSYDQAELVAADAGVPFTDLAGDACGEAIGPPGNLDTICSALRTGGHYFEIDVPDDDFETGSSEPGASIETQARIDAFEALYGNRTIKIYGNQPISAASLTLGHSVANGGDTDDSDLNYTLTWTSESTQILLEMAGHLAVGGAPPPAATCDVAGPPMQCLGWGDGLGSSSIKGGPYHFRLFQLNGLSLGNQDNQIKGADILVPATKSGRKFEDLQADGFTGDGADTGTDPGIQDWAWIRVFKDNDVSGDLSAGDTPQAEQVTGADGTYSFLLVSGDYIICEVAQGKAGTWFQSKPDPSVPANVVCEFDAIDPTLAPGGYAVTLAEGQIDDGNDFGNFQLVDTETDTLADPTGGNVIPGTAVKDTAEVTGLASLGDPTGSVKFYLCQPGDVTTTGCPSGGDLIDTVTIVDDGTADGVATGIESQTTTDTMTIGKYCWRAEYTSDVLYYKDSSFTNATDECFTTVPQDTETDTLADPTGGNVIPGTAVKDTAEVTGLASLGDPTGSVKFYLCQPGDVTTTGCPSGGDLIDTVTIVDDGTADGVATGIESQTTTDTMTIGKYCWRAEYTSDVLYYKDSSFTNATDECFTTVPQDTETDTLADPTGGNVIPGTAVKDTAEVTGLASLGDPTGSVKFYLCQPGDVTTTGCPSGGDLIDTVTIVDDGTADGVATGIESKTTTDTMTIGKYCWRAEYTSDVLYYKDSSFTNATDECFTTVPQDTKTDTLADPTGGNVIPGTAVKDTAEVTGLASLGDPTGSVKFYLCQPGDVTTTGCPSGGDLIDTVTIVDDGTADGVATGIESKTTTDTMTIGKYCWRAEYTSDVLYYKDSSFTNATDECFTTVPQDTKTDTLADPTGGNVIPGTAVKDTAEVTGLASLGDPTGSVKFYLCQPGDVTTTGCPSGGDLIDTVTIVDDGTADGVATGIESKTTTNTMTIGKYCWRAEYTSDVLYYKDSSFTNATDECFTTVPQDTKTDTLADPTGGNVIPGTAVKDTAEVTGLASLGDPTGSVKFYLCQPGDVTTTGCPSGGDLIDTVTIVDDGTADGVATGIESQTTTDTMTIGKYCWRAEYTSDVLYYKDSSFTNDTTECFTTVPQDTTTETTAVPTGGSIVPGASVYDEATVTGFGSLPDPTGTVAFFLCNPTEVDANGGDCSANGTQIGSGVALSGNGDGTSSATSASTTDTMAIGTYCWRAEYTSAVPYYNSSSHTNDTTECFTTVPQDTTTETTAVPTGGSIVPGAAVKDTAEVTGLASLGDPTGSVKFYLCQPGDVTTTGCPSGGDLIDTVTIVDDGTADGVATGIESQTTTNTMTIGKYCWRAEYTSDVLYYKDSSFTNATDECFTTVPQDTKTDTLADPTGGNVIPGTAVKDTAEVTGLASLGDPTGSVKFYLCQPGDVTTTGCPSGGDLIDTVTIVDDGTADGVATGIESQTTTDTMTIGKYCWRAEYTSDVLYYKDSSFTNATDECFTTVPQDTKTDTLADPTGDGIVPGTAVKDTAEVTGLASLGDPTGTVDFFLCNPTEVTAAGCPSGGTLIDTVTILPDSDVNDGTAHDIESTTTTNTMAIGKYCWRAEYTSDVLYYNDSSFTNDTDECFTVVFEVHPGTMGFWRNWDNHYNSTQFQTLVAALIADNATVYAGLTIPIVDAIYDFKGGTSDDQKVLAQLTALKLNLAVSGTPLQKNDDICLVGTVDVSGITNATAFFGTSTPTIGQVVAAVEGVWTGAMTLDPNMWSFNVSAAQKSMLIAVLGGINEGDIVTSTGCP